MFVSAYVSVHRMCTVPMRPEKGIRSLGTGVTDRSVDLPCGCWEPSLSHLHRGSCALDY